MAKTPKKTPKKVSPKKTPSKHTPKKIAKKTAPKKKAAKSSTAGKQIYFDLKNGTGKMPALGLGCWQIPNDVCANIVYTAIKNGVRCIDQAIHYANEKETGEGIKRAIDEGIVTRKDLFITSKLWVNHMRKEHVPLCLKRSMDDLGVDYLDLYLVHFPISLKYVPVDKQYPPHWFHDMKKPKEGMKEDLVPMSETWKAMEKLKDSGKVKNIGVSNMPILMIRDILSYCKHKPAVNQVEMHPYNPQETLVRFCDQWGIKITAYSAMGGPSFGESDNCLNNPVVKKVAKAHGKSTAQVLLRWSIQRGVAVIPKSVREERMKENLSVFDFALTKDEMAAITGLDR